MGYDEAMKFFSWGKQRQVKVEEPDEPCIVCGFLCGGMIGDICPVCAWENEGFISDDPNEVSGGPNYELSVTTAKSKFAEIGSVSVKMLAFVSAPKPEWVPDTASADVEEEIRIRQEQARQKHHIEKHPLFEN